MRAPLASNLPTHDSLWATIEGWTCLCTLQALHSRRTISGTGPVLAFHLAGLSSRALLADCQNLMTASAELLEKQATTSGKLAVYDCENWVRARIRGYLDCERLALGER